MRVPLHASLRLGFFGIGVLRLDMRVPLHASLRLGKLGSGAGAPGQLMGFGVAGALVSSGIGLPRCVCVIF